MAKRTQLETVLAVAALSVGVLLLVFASVSIWQEYQDTLSLSEGLTGVETPGMPVVGSQVSSSGSSAPSAPAAGDPILGTWSGTKSISLLFVSANGYATATFRDDYSGEISGEVHGAGMDEVFSGGFVWQNNGGGRYTGVVGENSVDFTLQGDTLSMVVNPKKLGVNDLLDLDIPVEMHRV
ncbi:MAG TPA: hypothetical protein O0X34_04645 [Methanocorpusculum sp.]|nr:hypothetical protein [Methanocorpusculum sp.]HJK74271.1 hypothetical protein [Methanocorpusculum sp.]